jgi:hypothetical protein
MLTLTLRRTPTSVAARVATCFSWQGEAISWGSKLLPTVVTSTMEAEYMANGNATKEALWLRKVMGTLCGMAVSVQMYCDSAGALAQVHNTVG